LRVIDRRFDPASGHVVRVRNDGVGFALRYAGGLFAPHQRLHAASRFDGIGLANVKRIIERHGGSIARSAPSLSPTKGRPS
jgi:light-regulated signal transduction histidine kinase (bacteriophytochrome)